MAPLLIALALVGYALVSKRLAATPLTAPLLFMLLGVALGPAGLGTIQGSADRATIERILESALALVLFTDSVAISGGDWRAKGRLPLRLLIVGLPLTIVLGAAVARWLAPGVEPYEALLLAICLAPTDAALGQAVVSDPRVPGAIREALNVESGLNDGLALPFFLVALAAAAEADAGAGPGAGEIFVRSLVFAAAIGAALGAAGAWALARAHAAGWVGRVWGQIAVLALIVLVYEAAVQVEGSGFIAAWVAGVAFGRVLRDRVPEATALAEDLGALLATVAFLGFGAILLGPVVGQLGWRELVYAALSLTLVRMIPVAAAFAGTRLALPTVGYVGWFGPRGLASIVFGLLLAEEALPDGDVVVRAVYATVALSVVLHGVTAAWGARRYATWFARTVDADPSIPEAADVGSPRVRRRVLAAGSGPAVP